MERIKIKGCSSRPVFKSDYDDVMERVGLMPKHIRDEIIDSIFYYKEDSEINELKRSVMEAKARKEKISVIAFTHLIPVSICRDMMKKPKPLYESKLYDQDEAFRVLFGKSLSNYDAKVYYSGKELMNRRSKGYLELLEMRNDSPRLREISEAIHSIACRVLSVKDKAIGKEFHPREGESNKEIEAKLKSSQRVLRLLANAVIPQDVKGYNELDPRRKQRALFFISAVSKSHVKYSGHLIYLMDDISRIEEFIRELKEEKKQ